MGWIKRRSFFFRPEHVGDIELFKLITSGKELTEDMTELEMDKEAEKLKAL